MALTPAWAPNFHPLVVHFPIALLVVAAMVDLAAVVFKHDGWVNATATMLYVLGAVFAVAAYVTGRSAAGTVLLPGMAHPLVDEHWNWAFRMIWYFGALAAVRLWLSFRARAPRYPIRVALLIGGLAGLTILYETAARGGELVFRHGVGVEAVGTKE